MLSDLSLVPYFPSAFLHLFAVESASLYMAMYAGMNLWTSAIPTWASFAEGCNAWTFTWSMLSQEHLCGDDNMVIIFGPNMLIAYVVLLIPVVGTLLLIATLFLYLAAGCPLSLGSGRYLRITWSLERRKMYRCCVALLAIGPMFLCTLVFVFAVVNACRGSSDTFKLVVSEFFSNNLCDAAMMLLSVKYMMYPRLPVHDWARDFDGITFKRSFMQMLTQTNDDFGVRLVDAVYRANYGHLEAFTALLPEGASSQSILDIVNDAETKPEPLWIALLDARDGEASPAASDARTTGQTDEEKAERHEY